MPPKFRSTPVAMRYAVGDQRGMFGWALPASLVVHLVVAALLILGLPVSLPQPEKEDAIKVDLVPPPEEPKPAKPEQAKAEPPPPPKEPQEAKAEKPVKPRLPPGLKHVVQFGEKDAGPGISRDGNIAEEGAASPAVNPDERAPAAQTLPPPETAQAPDQAPPSAAPDIPAPSSPDKQTPAAPPALAAAQAPEQVPLPAAPKISAPKPADAPKSRRTPKLQEAKTLFSTAATGDLMATTATGDMPRSERGAHLCAYQLDEQLRHAWPPFFPEWGPNVPLQSGTTVVDAPDKAFLSNGQWYQVSFRCEVDANATKVVSFAFQVGGPIPRSEWPRYGVRAE